MRGRRGCRYCFSVTPEDPRFRLVCGLRAIPNHQQAIVPSSPTHYTTFLILRYGKIQFTGALGISSTFSSRTTPSSCAHRKIIKVSTYIVVQHTASFHHATRTFTSIRGNLLFSLGVEPFAHPPPTGEGRPEPLHSFTHINYLEIVSDHFGVGQGG